jgi:hypothetical protein
VQPKSVPPLSLAGVSALADHVIEIECRATMHAFWCGWDWAAGFSGCASIGC